MYKCLEEKLLGHVAKSEEEETEGTGSLCFSWVSGLCGMLSHFPKDFIKPVMQTCALFSFWPTPCFRPFLLL
jgi:hypothetical protein